MADQKSIHAELRAAERQDQQQLRRELGTFKWLRHRIGERLSTVAAMVAFLFVIPPLLIYGFWDKRLRRRCQLHGDQLQLGVSHAAWGYVKEDYLDTISKQFPNAHSFFLGGCVVGRGPETVRVKYCPTCRRLESRWRESRRPTSRGR